jgi:hypothetical protein
MRPFPRNSIAVAALALSGIAAAQAPGPDPRLDAALNTNLYSQVERSVQLAKAVPPPDVRRKPEIDHGEAQQVREGVFVDRRLLPAAAAPNDESAVRVFRRDAR